MSCKIGSVRYSMYAHKFSICSFSPVKTGKANSDDSAKANLQYAVWAAEILQYQVDVMDQCKKITSGFENANGVTAENAGYNGIKIKQADVNLLAYP